MSNLVWLALALIGQHWLDAKPNPAAPTEAGDRMTATTFVVVTDDTPRADLLDLLNTLNEDAKKMTRRGKVGTFSEAYKLVHGRINGVLTDLEAKPA